MIKLLFLTRSLNYGGAQRQLATLAKSLDKRRFRVTVLSFYAGGPFADDLERNGVRVLSLGKRGRWDVLPFLSRLVSQAKRIRPDVVHGYLDTSNLLVLFLKLFLPCTRVIWGVRVSNMNLSYYDWLPRVTFRLERWLARFPDRLIVNSEAGRSHFAANGYPAAKMVVVPNGIDTSLFRPDLAARSRVRAEWAVAENEKLVATVGRLDPMKDHANFLAAAAIMARERPETKFVCVGTGPRRYEQALRRRASELSISEKIIWAGERHDIADVYNACDLLVSSSAWGEGFSNVIGEAMACGVPCVVTAVGDSALIVGSTGEVVPPGNPEALAAAVTSVLALDGARLGQAARDRIVENFSVQQLVQRTEAELMALMVDDERPKQQ